ncbi:hypothetical protein BB65665_16443 [Bacillus sp. 916]|nr:hypothetical protein BB65665_16443 [Bacillus sp. 916]
MSAHKNRIRLYFTVFGFSIDTLRYYERYFESDERVNDVQDSGQKQKPMRASIG